MQFLQKCEKSVKLPLSFPYGFAKNHKNRKNISAISGRNRSKLLLGIWGKTAVLAGMAGRRGFENGCLGCDFSKFLSLGLAFFPFLRPCAGGPRRRRPALYHYEAILGLFWPFCRKKGFYRLGFSPDF